MKLFDNFLGKTVLVVLTLILVVGILIPGIEATLSWATTIDNWTLEQAAEYWESQGYVAYADPDGTMYVYDVEPNDDDTYDLGTAIKRFQAIYGVSVYADGTLYVGSRSISDNGTQLKVDDTFISAPGTPDYVVGVNTATDDVPGATGYWVKSGSTGQVVYSTAGANNAEDDFQYAIDNLSATGGMVKLTTGDFVLGGTVFYKVSYTTIEGSGWDTLLYLNNGVDAPAIDTQPAVLYYCHLRHLRINGNAAGNVFAGDEAVVNFAVFYGSVENIFIEGSDRYGIANLRSGHTNILNNWIYGTESCAIFVSNDAYGLISGNRIQDSAVGTESAMRIGSDKEVIGNTILGGGFVAQIDCRQYGGAASERVLVQGNELINGLGMGIAYFSNSVVNENVITNVAKDAIDSNSNGYNVIANNKIKGVTTAGQACGILTGSNSVIQGNIIENSEDPALWIDAAHDNLVVIGNTIINSGNSSIYDAGILVVCGAGNYPDNLMIIGNRISGPQNYGIIQWTDGTTLSNSTIVNNNLLGNAVAAVYFPNLGTSNVIRGNIGYVTENSGTATILSGQTVIQVTHGLSITPDKNKIKLVALEIPTNAPRMLSVSDNATATYFWIVTDSDPGASNFDVGWSYAN